MTSNPTRPLKILSIIGTRPEAIKMAPVMAQLACQHGIAASVCVTGQHGRMVGQVLEFFGVKPAHTLEVMVAGQHLNALAGALFTQLDPLLAHVRPGRVIVHGDTTTAAIAAMAAAHRRIPIAHVEAGLRTGNMRQPWPEEMNRRLVDMTSDYLFAPTALAAANLKQEHIQGNVIVTGNTVIDALLATLDRINGDSNWQHHLASRFQCLPDHKKILLVTCHRRENHGDGLARLCDALVALSRRDDVTIAFPVHPNPDVAIPVAQRLSGMANICLLPPLPYPEFIYLMQRTHVILTDSGGMQEEAAALDIPTLVLRDVTERHIFQHGQNTCLVGTDIHQLMIQTAQLLDTEKRPHPAVFRPNPYGDGQAALRIANVMAGQPYTEFHAEETLRDWPACASQA